MEEKLEYVLGDRSRRFLYSFERRYFGEQKFPGILESFTEIR